MTAKLNSDGRQEVKSTTKVVEESPTRVERERHKQKIGMYVGINEEQFFSTGLKDSPRCKSYPLTPDDNLFCWPLRPQLQVLQ